MEFYRNAMFALDLQEWNELKERISEEEVVNALNDYIDAYVSYKSASYEYECRENEKEKEKLWRACTNSTKEKKKKWVALQSVLGEDCDYVADE